MKNIKSFIAPLMVLAVIFSLVTGLIPAEAGNKITLKSGKAAPDIIYTGKSYKLKVPGAKVEFSSSNEKIATIDAVSGEMTVIAPGTVKIKAKNANTGKAVASAIFTVNQRSTAINYEINGELNPSEIYIGRGEQAMIKTSLEPSTSTDVIRFASEDKTHVKVGETSGKLDAKACTDYNFVTITIYAKATKGTQNKNKNNTIAMVKVYVLQRLDLDVPALQDAFYRENYVRVAALDAASDVTSENGKYYYTDKDTQRSYKFDYKDVITYQWYKAMGDVPDEKTDTPIEGATSPTYTPDVTEAGITKYYCKVSVEPQGDHRGLRLGRTVYTNISTITVGGKVNVSFDTNGGYWYSGITEYSKEIDKGYTFGGLPTGVGYSYYYFAGWATTPNATTPNVDDATRFTEDTTLYAVWAEPDPYDEPIVVPPPIG